MNFSIDSAESLNIHDRELSELLTDVYVGGGFTDPILAKSQFEAQAVRERGRIFSVRENTKMDLAAIVIYVAANSHSTHFAKKNEVEMQLLAVKSIYRRNGIAKLLVEKTVDIATQEGNSKIILWTQEHMTAAHRLYESTEFVRITEKDFSKNNRNFWIYERVLNA